MQGDVALAAFDLADEGPVHVAAVSEGFLAETEFEPASSHSRAELARGGRDRWFGSGARHVAITYVPTLPIQRRYIP